MWVDMSKCSWHSIVLSLSLSLSPPLACPQRSQRLGPSPLLIGQQTLKAQYYFGFFGHLCCGNVTKLLQFLFCFGFFCIPSSSSDASPKIFHTQTSGYFSLQFAPAVGRLFHTSDFKLAGASHNPNPNPSATNDVHTRVGGYYSS